MDQGTVRAWHAFHAGHRDPASDRVREVIAASWVRSQERAVDPERLQVPRTDFDAESRFVTAAVPVLLGMADLLAGTSTSIAITDENGTVVWRWFSDPQLGRQLDATEFEPGSSLREDNAGTNGIGVASTTHRPVTVVGAEHYKAAWHRWACSAAPVVDPVGRQVVGVVNVACRAEDANQLLPVTVRSLVNEIRTTLQASAAQPEQRLLAAHLRARSASVHPVVSVNARTMISDDHALRASLDHRAIWEAVAQARPSDALVNLGPGIDARVHWLARHQRELGCVLEILRGDGVARSGARPPGVTLTDLELAEYRVIREALRRNAGNKRAAARELGISPGKLYQRVRRYRLADQVT